MQGASLPLGGFGRLQHLTEERRLVGSLTIAAGIISFRRLFLGAAAGVCSNIALGEVGEESLFFVVSE